MTGAARVLHVTQPTLSRQLQELEEELGQKLFVRGSHSVTLTPEGMLLRKRAEEILDMVRKTETEFGSLGETAAGEVHIGGGETEAMRQIARIIGELQQEHPRLRFHLYSGNAEDVTERLDKGLLDFGLQIQPVDITRYHSLRLPDQDVWGVLMRKSCPLAGKTAVTRRDLEGLPLICSRQVMRRISQENAYADWFGAERSNLKVTATYNLIYNAALLVEEGGGYAITLDKLVDMTGHRDLCFRPLEPKVESGVYFVWKKHQLFSKAAELFLDRLRRHLAAGPESAPE